MFMRVNSKCAHQLRPPPGRIERNAAVGKPLTTYQAVGSQTILRLPEAASSNLPSRGGIEKRHAFSVGSDPTYR